MLKHLLEHSKSHSCGCEHCHSPAVDAFIAHEKIIELDYGKILQESPIFDGKIHGFRLRFSQQNLYGAVTGRLESAQSNGLPQRKRGHGSAGAMSWKA